MSLADIQNPIANMPLMQQMQQSQHQQIQSHPMIATQKFEHVVDEQLHTVQERDQHSENRKIDDEERRSELNRRRPKPDRGKQSAETDGKAEPAAPQKKAGDGIHGVHLDIQV